MHLKDIIDRIEISTEWRDNYAEFVPKFIIEASTKHDWTDWDQEVFSEYFEKSKDQCVSSLQQGYFSHSERKDIKDNWNRLSPLLKKIAESQDIPLYEIYDQIRSVISDYTTVNREAGVNRMLAGLQPKLLSTIVSYSHLNELFHLLKNKSILAIPGYLSNDWCKDSNRVLKIFQTALPEYNYYDLITFPWQTLIFLQENDLNKISMQIEQDKIVKLLTYKKQIILQGPPGTGKTKIAKEIASLVTGIPQIAAPLENINDEDIINALSGVIKITTPAEQAEYEVINVDADAKQVTLRKTTGKEDKTSFGKIKEFYKDQLWKQPIGPNDDRRAAAIAKIVFHKQPTPQVLANSDQFKIIQFHPSYSYEDFVRGIVVHPNETGAGVLYKTENKIFGEFAQTALQNFLDSQTKDDEVSIQHTFKQKLEQFINNVREEIDLHGQFSLGTDTTAKIIGVVDDAFIYSFETRKEIKYQLLFSDLVRIDAHPNEIKRSTDISDIERGYLKMQGKYPYYFRVYNFITAITLSKEQTTISTTTLKKYVIVIDEINRANLSSVLGELIYALEYREDYVESMYAVDGNNKLRLPPNLYIIGTMNTADRSVGHIDYAIRRRFAFVDIEPKDLSDEKGVRFDKHLFEKVSKLFDTNRSQEFEKKDVQLGHSYFIDKTEKDGGSMDLRFKFEIKPILLEYVKDGILIGENIKQQIDDLLG
jgi:5-methylcytosine-specific restriction protein B